MLSILSYLLILYGNGVPVDPPVALRSYLLVARSDGTNASQLALMTSFVSTGSFSRSPMTLKSSGLRSRSLRSP